MQIENKEVLQQFKEFISSISEDDNVCVLHDTDMDGMTAGVLAKKGLEELGINPKLTTPFYHGERSITPVFLSQLQDNNITAIVCVDIPLESYPGIEMLEGIKVLVMDHHPIEQEYSHLTNLTIIKPIMFEKKTDPSQICSANMVYTFFSELIDMHSYDWIAALGIISDSTYQTEKEFVDKILVRTGNKVKKDVFSTDFSRAASYGSYANCVGSEDAYENIFNALDTANNYKDVIEKLKEYLPVEKEVNKLVSQFNKKKQEIKDAELFFYEFTAKYSINSIVSNIISHNKVPNKTLIIAEKLENHYKISARRQDLKIHVGELLRDCIEGLENANGGGHRPAAGAKVMKKDYETFKNRVIEWCKKHESTSTS